MKDVSVDKKIYSLLNEIKIREGITPSCEPINIPFNNGRELNTSETQTILKKLEKDHGVISIIHISDGMIRHGERQKYLGHVFTMTDKFDQYYQELGEKLKRSEAHESENVRKIVEKFSDETISNYKVLLNVIKNKNDSIPHGATITIICETQYHNNNQVDSSLIEGLVKKLESDFGVIKIIDFKEYHNITGYENRPDFKIRIIEERFSGFLDLIEGRTKAAKPVANVLEKCLRISYSENSREILLNDFFLISKPDFNSENEQVFYYLYRNPNKVITKAEFEENFNGNQTLTKDFSKIVENLKFKKDLRKAFFDVSQDSIKFYNPVSKERLQELGIKNISIEIK